MAEKDHDRNLLFGILAVQMDFIGRDALIAAMHAWVLAKDRPLGEILVEQKAMAADSRELLEALVQKHLAMHANDPQQSLAAVSSISSVRDDLRQITDHDVQATLAHLPAARPADHYATFAPSQSAGSATSSGSRFRILRPHAEGGLGKVSVARDEELSREVALKEIKERHADDPNSRARFLLEAEITGGLEHPGIVPVYGLGQYADGRPYYAMRFIRGDSLKEAVDRYHDPKAKKSKLGERAVELRKLLGRFIDVCNAIGYAHSRGVLHRDLKPGNIMLGQYGETLVVDWGLAKAVDRPELKSDSTETFLKPASGSAAAATQMGSALGTPQYMSPEQAAGRLDLLGPVSDVYSLGATLYYVLTGKPPIEDVEIGAVLRKVERGEFRPPRTLNPEIDRPLSAICLKAMALKPDERYGSPKDLADDVEHWMADEPVLAYRERFPARATRWARKHKTVVVGSVGLIVVAAIALAVTTVLVKQQQRQTEEARQQAVAARDQARQRFGLALGALNDMVLGIQTKLKIRPDTEDLRKDLLKNARKRVQELLQDAERQGNPDQTLIWSYFGMGDVDLLMGDTLAAQKEYASGSELAAKLAAAHPNDSSLQSDLGVSYVNLGKIAMQLGHAQEALDLYRKTLSIRQHRAEVDPNDPKAQRGLGVIDELLGDALRRSAQTQEALDYYLKAKTIRQKLADAEPASDAAQYDLSVSFERLGDLAMQLGPTQTALDYYQKAMEIRARLAAADPKNVQAQRNLSIIYERAGDVMQRLNQIADARGFYGKAVEICARLAEADPKDAQAQRELGVSYLSLGDLLRRLGETNEALDNYRKELAICARLAHAEQANVQRQNDLAVAYERIGDETMQLGHTKEALEYYQKLQEIRAQLADAYPTNAEGLRNLSISYNKLADISLKSGQTAEAIDFYRKVLAIREPLAEKDPADARTQRDLAYSCELLGDANLQLGRTKESIDFYQRAQTIYERLAAIDPKNADARRDLSESYYHLACGWACRSATEENDASKNALQQAIDFLRRAVEKGCRDLNRLKTDKRINSLRDREEFKKLVEELEKAKGEK